MRGNVVIRKQQPKITVDKSMSLIPVEDGSGKSGFSLVRVTIDGTHSRRVNNKSDKGYYVLSGSCTFVTDTESYKLSSGDFILLPAGVVAEIVGDAADVFIIVSPAFDENDEEIFGDES